MRSKDDLEAMLTEHLNFLETSFREFDSGDLHEAMSSPT
jgi:hypothetical protein